MGGILIFFQQICILPDTFPKAGHVHMKIEMSHKYV